MLSALASDMTAQSDVQASNMAAIGRTLYLAGAKVSHVYPVGPRPGIAVMVTMLSYEGKCCITATIDPDAITDIPMFEKCFHEGFEEVIAIVT